MKEGLVAQVNSFPNVTPVDFKISNNELIEALNKAQMPHDSDYNWYLNQATYNVFWDIIYKDRGIKLYGIKYIKPALGGGFLYEAIVFDDYPKNKESYSICIEDTEEEVSIIKISDSCIRFRLWKRWPDGDNFRLTWD